MARKTRERQLAELVSKALREFEKLSTRGQMFVSTNRIQRRKTMDPTDHQKELYEWIKRRGFVKWELTLGMHWGMLGGLMARGLILETKENGVRGIKAL